MVMYCASLHPGRATGHHQSRVQERTTTPTCPANQITETGEMLLWRPRLLCAPAESPVTVIRLTQCHFQGQHFQSAVTDYVWWLFLDTKIHSTLPSTSLHPAGLLIFQFCAFLVATSSTDGISVYDIYTEPGPMWGCRGA